MAETGDGLVVSRRFEEGRPGGKRGRVKGLGKQSIVSGHTKGPFRSGS